MYLELSVFAFSGTQTLIICRRSKFLDLLVAGSSDLVLPNHNFCILTTMSEGPAANTSG